MSNYAFIKTESLTEIANEIRNKIQSTAKMTPAEMADAVASISLGTVDYLAMLGSNTLTTYESESITRINRNLFQNATRLTTISAPNCTLIDQYAFSGCTNLQSFSALNVTNLSAPNIFENCKSLPEVFFSKISTNLGTNVFSGCSSLRTIDIGNCYRINHNAFNGCAALSNLIIRKTTMCQLQNINAFSNCGEITVFVPSNTISLYEADSVWMAVTGATLHFAALEGSEFE